MLGNEHDVTLHYFPLLRQSSVVEIDDDSSIPNQKTETTRCLEDLTMRWVIPSSLRSSSFSDVAHDLAFLINPQILNLLVEEAIKSRNTRNQTLEREEAS
jgi:hypothetical protein